VSALFLRRTLERSHFRMAILGTPATAWWEESSSCVSACHCSSGFLRRKSEHCHFRLLIVGHFRMETLSAPSDVKDGLVGDVAGERDGDRVGVLFSARDGEDLPGLDDLFDVTSSIVS